MVTSDTPEPAPLYERFVITYPSGVVLGSFHCGGATLQEAQIGHPLAKVKAVADSLVEPSGA